MTERKYITGNMYMYTSNSAPHQVAICHDEDGVIDWLRSPVTEAEAKAFCRAYYLGVEHGYKTGRNKLRESLRDLFLDD